MRQALLILAIMSLSVSVIAVGDDAVYVSDTIPSIMGPGHTYTVTVTMRNTGTNMWTKDTGHKLGAVGGSDPFATSTRIGFGFYEGIGNGQEKTFTITMTAPTLSNINEVRSFTTDWQMIHEGAAWFGAILSKRVIVSWAAKVPDAPTVSFPASGEVFMSNRPDIIWNDIPNDGCEVHVCTANSPDSGIVWDSGYINQLQNTSCIAGKLPTQKILYIFVRLHNPHGWGQWSKGGHFIYTDGEFISNSVNPLGDAYVLADDYSMQRDHNLCFNPDLNQYFATFADYKYGNSPWITTWRMAADGTPVSPAINLTGGNGCGGLTSAAYNSIKKEYFVTNQDCDGNTFASRINSINGSIVRNTYLLGHLSSLEPAMCHSSGSINGTNKYLHVYRYGGCEGIRALLLNGDTGDIESGVINILEDGKLMGGPEIAYNPENDEFLVTFEYLPIDNEAQDIYAFRINAATGQIISQKLPLVATSLKEWHQGVIYIKELHKYLMVYEAWGDASTAMGLFINPDGTPDGSRFPIAPAGAPWDGGNPRVAWSPIAGEFLVVWHSGSSSDVFARRLSVNGTPIGSAFRVNGHINWNTGNYEPKVEANPVTKDFMFLWHNSYSAICTRMYRPCPVPSADTTAPSVPSSVLAIGGFERNIINWTNPSDADFARVVIRFSTSSYPTTPTDGSLLTDKANTPGSTDSFTHMGLIGGTKYYYSLFAYDCWGNYSPAVNVGPTALRVISILNSNFGIPSSGWTLANWGFDPDPLHWGTIGWEGGVGSPTGGMRCKGYGDTDSDDRYLREGAEMKRIVSTTGLNNINISYDLRAGTLGDPRSGVGTGTGSVLKNDIQDQLIVYYSTAGVDGPWTEVDWLGHNALLSYLTYGKRYIDLSSVSGINDNASFALKFILQFNSKIEVGDYCDIDNVKVTGSILGKNSTCGSVKSLDNTTPVSFADKVLYHRQSGYGYIEDVNRTSGIRVEGSGISSLTPDQAISVIGTMQTNPTTGERYIQVSTLLRGASASVKPLAMNQRGLKKVLADGMYVKTFGRVKTGSITSTSYVILDGSDSDGIKVITTSAPSVTANTYVSVTGAAGIESGNRVIYQSQADTYTEN